MKCPKCQAVNREHRHFCRQCGFRLLNPCAQCGFANDVGDTYCGGCGRSLTEAATAALPSGDVGFSKVPSATSLPHAFLTEILKEEPVKAPSDLNEAKKKALTQEEIDKLLGK